MTIGFGRHYAAMFGYEMPEDEPKPEFPAITEAMVTAGAKALAEAELPPGTDKERIERQFLWNEKRLRKYARAVLASAKGAAK